MIIAAYVPSMMDRSRVENALPEAYFVAAAEQLKLVDADVFVLDLDAEGSLEVLEGLVSEGRVVGFGRHTNEATLATADEVGCDAMARSAFLPALTGGLRTVPLQPPTNPMSTPADCVERVASVPVWRHRVPVGHGVTTPGAEDTEAELGRLAIPESLSGQRVLDVGCSDGYYSFVCEQRGAQVTAVDDQSSMLAGEGRQNGFETAAALRGSAVDYRVADVQDLASGGIDGPYDLILFINVLYHLENPMLALRQLASVAAPGATLIVKTYYRTDVRLWIRGRCLGFDLSSRPKWWFFPGAELGGDPTNWWAPSRAGLGALLTATGWSYQLAGRWRDRQYVHATSSG